MTPFLSCLFCGTAAFSASTPSTRKGLRIPFLVLPHHPFATSSSLYGAAEESTEPREGHCLSRLIPLLGGSPSDLLRLHTTPEGVRGICLNHVVEAGDILLQMPLDSCLRDDEAPSWLQRSGGENDSDNGYQAVQIQGWVTRLAASLLHAQNNTDRLSEGVQEWLHLLPKSLKTSLPVHWSESTLRSTNCRPLEVAVDSAFFARAEPLSELAASNQTQTQIEKALDLVQTRACRCSTLETLSDGSDSSSDLRVLVPVFDMINHNYEPNAEFFRDGDSMMVRALRDMGTDEEVTIHYGSATMPVWKCLFSYGFVPPIEGIYEHNTAEIFVDNFRFEVSPTEIPFELVQYQAQKLGCEDIENVEFTPEIGNAIVKQLEVCASSLLEEEDDDDSSGAPPQDAQQLIKSLKESHRRTLLACAGGLREFVEGQ